MNLLIISAVACLASFLTLFSGFGLGTILMPVFAIFFALPTAIALTAIVHFLNNLFKLILLGRHADPKVVWQFGAPAILAAVAGAKFLLALEGISPLWTYHLGQKEFSITTVKILVAFVMIIFVLLETLPRFQSLAFDRKFLVWGGCLSGFFGGLSGHQGALRSVFLIKCGLSKESFIASAVTIACLVDISRLYVYWNHFSTTGFSNDKFILGAAIWSAFLGTFLGNRLVPKITLRFVQLSVVVMLFVLAALLASGMI